MNWKITSENLMIFVAHINKNFEVLILKKLILTLHPISTITITTISIFSKSYNTELLENYKEKKMKIKGRNLSIVQTRRSYVDFLKKTYFSSQFLFNLILKWIFVLILKQWSKHQIWRVIYTPKQKKILTKLCLPKLRLLLLNCL